MSTTSRTDRSSSSTTRPSRVLVLDIKDATQIVNANVIYQIASPHGVVLRIIVREKIYTGNVVHQKVFVEFANVESASKAKAALDGQHIYDDCCALKVSYDGQNLSLKIQQNDVNHWDFEKSGPIVLGESGASKRSRSPELSPIPKRPRRGLDEYPVHRHHRDEDRYRHDEDVDDGRFRNDHDDAHFRNYNFRADEHVDGPGPRYRSPQRQNPAPPGRRPVGNFEQGHPRFHDNNNRDFGPRFGPTNPFMGRINSLEAPSHVPPGRVIIGYNFPPSMDPSKVFNLFCLYGNVLRIKFLMKTPGSVMIEMSDPDAAYRSINNLTGLTISGHEITLKSSSQPEIYANFQVTQRKLKNLAPVFYDYSDSGLNRFLSPEEAAKNRMVSPTKVLHFFKLSNEIDSAEKLCEIFAKFGAPAPIACDFLKSPPGRISLSGHMEFATLEACVEALINMNNARLSLDGKVWGPRLRLCFSTRRGV